MYTHLFKSGFNMTLNIITCVMQKNKKHNYTAKDVNTIPTAVVTLHTCGNRHALDKDRTVQGA